ncbi:MAG: NUDIX hydrolase [Lachnospiraceae bacterium]|nr:NUDIX hydrolase [Lachnospiraceae bacterium]
MKFRIDSLFETKFIKLFDIRYAEGKHYFSATRRNKEALVANMDDDAFKAMLPDAVSCCVILRREGEEDRLLLTEEYRYPVGQFLLSVPAGLIDPEDRALPRTEAVFATAKREVEEETGLSFREGDGISLISPCLFSSPGMTDESNAMVKLILHEPDLSALSSEGAVGSEQFSGYRLLTRDEARQILEAGADSDGRSFSVYTWIGIRAFLDEQGKEKR